MNFEEIPIDKEMRSYLLNGAGDHWSAGVHSVPLEDGTYICILNPTHDVRRQRISLMEECSHIFLRHRPTSVRSISEGLSTRDFNSSQEQEAYGVGAAAIMPWATFFHDLDGGMSVVDIASKYKISTELAAYRIKITGATNLYRSRQNAKASRRAG